MGGLKISSYWLQRLWHVNIFMKIKSTLKPSFKTNTLSFSYATSTLDEYQLGSSFKNRLYQVEKLFMNIEKFYFHDFLWKN